MRQTPNELELETNPATTRMVVSLAAAGLTALLLGIGGLLYLTSQTGTAAVDDEAAQMLPTSINGWQAQMLSGGQIKADEFDTVRRQACEAIEALNAGMPPERRQATCAQMHEVMRDPAKLAKARKAMQERVQQGLR
ncbi:MAG: hypothetical protein ACKVP7_18445 [Hyphomicrobiaceae bacterium]